MVDVTKNQTKKRRRSTKELLETIDILPYKRMDENVIVTTQDTYQTLLKIETKTIYGMSNGEKYQVMEALTNLCRLYVEDFCIVSMMFPAYTEVNSTYWRKKYLQAREENDEAAMESCSSQLALMGWVEKNLANHEFYLFIYADTEKKLEQNYQTLLRSSSMELSITDVSPTVIEKILFKLNNLNTEI